MASAAGDATSGSSSSTVGVVYRCLASKSEVEEWAALCERCFVATSGVPACTSCTSHNAGVVRTDTDTTLRCAHARVCPAYFVNHVKNDPACDLSAIFVAVDSSSNKMIASV